MRSVSEKKNAGYRRLETWDECRITCKNWAYVRQMLLIVGSHATWCALPSRYCGQSHIGHRHQDWICTNRSLFVIRRTTAKQFYFCRRMSTTLSQLFIICGIFMRKLRPPTFNMNKRSKASGGIGEINHRGFSTRVWSNSVKRRVDLVSGVPWRKVYIRLMISTTIFICKTFSRTQRSDESQE